MNNFRHGIWGWSDYLAGRWFQICEGKKETRKQGKNDFYDTAASPFRSINHGPVRYTISDELAAEVEHCHCAQRRSVLYICQSTSFTNVLCWPRIFFLYSVITAVQNFRILLFPIGNLASSCVVAGDELRDRASIGLAGAKVTPASLFSKI